MPSIGMDPTSEAIVTRCECIIWEGIASAVKEKAMSERKIAATIELTQLECNIVLEGLCILRAALQMRAQVSTANKENTAALMKELIRQFVEQGVRPYLASAQPD